MARVGKGEHRLQEYYANLELESVSNILPYADYQTDLELRFYYRKTSLFDPQREKRAILCEAGKQILKLHCKVNTTACLFDLCVIWSIMVSMSNILKLKFRFLQ